MSGARVAFAGALILGGAVAIAGYPLLAVVLGVVVFFTVQMFRSGIEPRGVRDLEQLGLLTKPKRSDEPD